MNNPNERIVLFDWREDNLLISIHFEKGRIQNSKEESLAFTGTPPSCDHCNTCTHMTGALMKTWHFFVEGQRKAKRAMAENVAV